jgi:hypothetical protein
LDRARESGTRAGPWHRIIGSGHASSPRLVEVEGKLAAMMAAMEAMERRFLGPKSEKMPPPESELRRKEPKEDAEARRLAALERRRQRAAQREKLRAQTVTGADHDFYAEGLRASLYNFMLGLGLDRDVRTWFPRRGRGRLPAPRVPPDLIRRALAG